MEKELTIAQLQTIHPAESFTLICGGRVVRVMFADIVRIARCGSQAVIYTSSSIYYTHRSLQDLLNDLPAQQFFRVNRCHIVALNEVTRFSKRKVFIQGQVIPLTDYYRKQIVSELHWILNRDIKSMLYEPHLSTAL